MFFGLPVFYRHVNVYSGYMTWRFEFPEFPHGSINTFHCFAIRKFPFSAPGFYLTENSYFTKRREATVYFHTSFPTRVPDMECFHITDWGEDVDWQVLLGSYWPSRLLHYLINTVMLQPWLHRWEKRLPNTDRMDSFTRGLDMTHSRVSSGESDIPHS